MTSGKKPTSNPLKDLESAAQENAAAESEQITLDPKQLLDQLASMEAKLKKLEADNERLANENESLTAAGGLRFSPNEQAYAGEDGHGGYEFRVEPITKDGEFEHLKPTTVRCVDESEAIRWYCQKNEMKPGTGKALDPVRVRLKVTCASKERAESIILQKRIALLRVKINNGQELTAEDQELARRCEKQLFGFDSDT